MKTSPFLLPPPVGSLLSRLPAYPGSLLFVTGLNLALAKSLAPDVTQMLLGKKLRLDANLKLLERHGFIARRQDEIAEGPMLDVLLDYDVLAPRILDGALADVLLRERAGASLEAATDEKP